MPQSKTLQPSDAPRAHSFLTGLVGLKETDDGLTLLFFGIPSLLHVGSLGADDRASASHRAPPRGADALGQGVPDVRARLFTRGGTFT